MKVPSYPKVHTIGHPAIRALFVGPVCIQEKYDGSQVSWCWDQEGRLHLRSKNGMQFGGPENRLEPDAMFRPAVDHLNSLTGVEPGMIFRGEVLNAPKHNVLCYDRQPRNGIILFDVEEEPNVFVPEGIVTMADVMDIEAARPFLTTHDRVTLEKYLEAESSLGGVPVEGVVIKNYLQFGVDDKILAGKLVRDDFKERAQRDWKGNPQKDILFEIAESLNNEARWQKAVQHKRDEGQLEGTPRDIGLLIQELKADTLAEETHWIQERLMQWAMPQVTRMIGRGFAEWYKQQLVNEQFAEPGP